MTYTEGDLVWVYERNSWIPASIDSVGDHPDPTVGYQVIVVRTEITFRTETGQELPYLIGFRLEDGERYLRPRSLDA